MRSSVLLTYINYPYIEINYPYVEKFCSTINIDNKIIININKTMITAQIKVNNTTKSNQVSSCSKVSKSYKRILVVFKIQNLLSLNFRTKTLVTRRLEAGIDSVIRGRGSQFCPTWTNLDNNFFKLNIKS